jgi:hypothetical protein
MRPRFATPPLFRGSDPRSSHDPPGIRGGSRSRRISPFLFTLEGEDLDGAACAKRTSGLRAVRRRGPGVKDEVKLALGLEKAGTFVTAAGAPVGDEREAASANAVLTCVNAFLVIAFHYRIATMKECAMTEEDAARGGGEYAPDLLGAMAEMQRAGLGSLNCLGVARLEAMGDLRAEVALFIAERINEDLGTQHEILHCTNAAELQQVQSRFLQKAIDQYAAETGRIVELGNQLWANAVGRSSTATSDTKG